MARVYELDMLLPQEEVKIIVVIHSGNTLFPCYIFFQNSEQQSQNPQLKDLGLQ